MYGVYLRFTIHKMQRNRRLTSHHRSYNTVADKSSRVPGELTTLTTTMGLLTNMRPPPVPFRRLGRRKRRVQTPGVLTMQECESLQLALENELRSPRDRTIVGEQVSRFRSGADKNSNAMILCLDAFTFNNEECTNTKSAKPTSAFTMYFRDDVAPVVNTDEERDNVPLLQGSIREDDLPEDRQASEEKISLLKESSFAGGPIAGFDMYKVDDSGDLEKEQSDDDSIFDWDQVASPIWALSGQQFDFSPSVSIDEEAVLARERPTDPDVLASLVQQEASQTNSPRYHNLSAYAGAYGKQYGKPEPVWKTRQDKLLAQKNATKRQRRALAKRIKRDCFKTESNHQLFAFGCLETVAELSFEDERTLGGSVWSKSRPRPPAISTGFDYERHCRRKDSRRKDKKHETPEFDTTMSTTDSTGSSGDPAILEEVDMMNHTFYEI